MVAGLERSSLAPSMGLTAGAGAGAGWRATLQAPATTPTLREASSKPPAQRRAGRSLAKRDRLERSRGASGGGGLPGLGVGGVGAGVGGVGAGGSGDEMPARSRSERALSWEAKPAYSFFSSGVFSGRRGRRGGGSGSGHPPAIDASFAARPGEPGCSKR